MEDGYDGSHTVMPESIQITEKPKIRRERIVVEREGRLVNVDITDVDYSEGNKQSPLEIYCQGFGQGTEGIGTLDDILIDREAKQLKAHFAKVSITNIPPLYDQESDRSKEPTFGVDARVILEAFDKQKIESRGRPVYISGYSEGAGVALAIAGEIDKRQKEQSVRDGGSQAPENKLRLWSLTGTMDLDPKPRGLTVAGSFTKEVSKITLIELLERYGKLTNENVSIENTEDLKEFAKKFTSFVANPKNWRDVWGELKESSEGNLGMLKMVLKRMSSGKGLLDGLHQLKKMETRSAVCEQLGKNWEVNIAVPRNDLIYPWWKVRRTIRNLQDRDSKVEVISPDVPGKFDPNRVVRLTELGQRYLFPNAGKVSFNVVGDSKTFFGEKDGQKGMGLGQVHVGPENHPEEYLKYSSFV